jgi:hypothetical protein
MCLVKRNVELEERSNGKGKLAEASEEGRGPRRSVEPVMMMNVKCVSIRQFHASYSMLLLQKNDMQNIGNVS